MVIVMKFIFGLVISFLFIVNVNASKLEVTLDKCVDGDTAWFIPSLTVFEKKSKNPI